MNKEQMNKYAYELMIKNNPEEAIKNLMLLDRLQGRIDKAIEYIKHSWWIRFDQLYDNSHDLKDWEVKELMEILKGKDEDRKTKE